MIFGKREKESVSKKQFNFKITKLEEKFDKLISAMEDMMKRQKILVDKVSGMEDDINEVGSDISEFLENIEYKPPPETEERLRYIG